MEDIVLISFIVFAAASFVIAVDRKSIQLRTRADWVTDLTSLAMHFFILPVLQLLIVHGLLESFAPAWKNSLSGTWLISIGLYLVLDYGWYWNHRIFHMQTPLWNLHKTHHSPSQMDVFITSRNALVSHFFMIYFWFIGAAVFVLDDPKIFLSLAVFGGVINFWGHTSFSLPCNSLTNRILSILIVTPREHSWHHSRANPNCNYGTVISIWDRLHGTFYCESEHPAEYGDPAPKKIWAELIWPF